MRRVHFDARNEGDTDGERMHNQSTLKKVLYRTGSWAYYIATVVYGFLVFILEVIDPSLEPYSNWPAMVLALIIHSQNWSLQLFILIGIFLIYSVAAKQVGDPWIWEKLQYLIDGMRENVYREFGDDRVDEHRVTLFQRKRFVMRLRRPDSSVLWPYGRGCYPWSGWLVPVLRSGHTAQISSAVFLAPTGKDSHTVEGVVGKVWASKKIIVVDDLKEIRQTSADKTKKTYAKKTYCDVSVVERYLSQDRTPPRSIGAIPIDVHGKVWGALVFDSQALAGVTKEKMSHYTLTAGLMGRLLEKV